MKRFVSAVNQPERVFLSSFDDQSFVVQTEYNAGLPNRVLATTYDRFRIQLPTAILEPERCQLLRASIPNAQVTIPDYQLTFWYARVNTTGPPVTQYLNVRWFPSYWTGATGGVPVNRIVANYADLLSLMNTAAAATDISGQNPYHVPGDISFSYDALTRKFSFQGLTTGYAYYEVGYNDPQIKALTANMKYGTYPVPFVQDTTMNLRLGFTSPIVDEDVIIANNVNEPFVAESWADLVYTQNVILLANIIPGSSLGSGGQHNVLASVPINAPPLGVGNFTAPMVNWLTKVMKEIYEIEIVMLDDNYQPYRVPNNAVVNVEMGFSYLKL